MLSDPRGEGYLARFLFLPYPGLGARLSVLGILLKKYFSKRKIVLFINCTNFQMQKHCYSCYLAMTLHVTVLLQTNKRKLDMEQQQQKKHMQLPFR